VKVANEAGDVAGASQQKAVYWLGDAMARFGGGFLLHALHDKISGYTFMFIGGVVSLLGNISLFMILTLGVDGGFMPLVASGFLGLGIGLTIASQA
jgi:hypothetical protein